jgi:hypothetical protein
MSQAVSTNDALRAAIQESGLTYRDLAEAVKRVARENGDEHVAVDASYISRWTRAARPHGKTALYLAEALSRRLGWIVTPADIGFPMAIGTTDATSTWDTDTLVALADLGRQEVDDVDRRGALRGAAAYSLAALPLPPRDWWDAVRERGAARRPTGVQRVGMSDVEAVRSTTQEFLRTDQRYGGGHARAAIRAYLTSDVARLLRGTFADDSTRLAMYTAASELAYTGAWMRFDNAEHAAAQKGFALAMKLAAEANDAPLAGHILRAMAHQAIDLGHGDKALEIANNSIEQQRYALASPRERALIGVVRARALAATRHKRQASDALLRAEDDLAAATAGGDEPGRVFFFGEASLAHETACTLRDMGDLVGAEREFRRSIRTRNATAFRRTHVVTLGYLGSVQLRRGELDRACATWKAVMDELEGIQSGRTRDAVQTIHDSLKPIARRASGTVRELDRRAAAYLKANPKPA